MRIELKLVNKGNYWDFDVYKGLPITITGEEEEMQRAQVAAFVQKGSIPLLPTTGIDWLKYLLHEISFTQLDAQIRMALNVLTESSKYVPTYNITDGQTSLSISKVIIPGLNS